jgi:hypothetical protein
MPKTLDQIISEIRVDCNHPDVHKPDDEALLQIVADVWQSLHNDMQNQQPSWALLNIDVHANTASESTAEFLIPECKFGKPVRVHMLDDCLEFKEKLKIVRYPELVSGDATREIREIAFRSKDGAETYFRIAPKLEDGELASTIRIWYEVGEIGQMSNGVQPLPNMPQFHSYLRTECSLRALPYCEWSRFLVPGEKELSGIERIKLFEEMRNTLRPTLLGAQTRERENWRNYIATGWADGDGGLREYADWSKNEY